MKRSDHPVRVWHASPSLAASAAMHARLMGLITPQEAERVGRYRQPERQWQALVARAMLRCALAETLNTQPLDLTFETSPTGKPFLSGGDCDAHLPAFSVSHTAGQVVVAIAQADALGIDIEASDRLTDARAFSKRHFHAIEAADVAATSDAHAPIRAARYWTLKEAYAKAVGVGVGLGFDQAVFDLHIASPVLNVALSAVDTDGWDFRFLDLNSQYICALAVQGMAGDLQVQVSDGRDLVWPESQGNF